MNDNFLLISCKSLQKKQAFEMRPAKERHQADREWVGGATPFLKKVVIFVLFMTIFLLSPGSFPENSAYQQVPGEILTKNRIQGAGSAAGTPQIYLESSPSGAEIYVDGTKKGISTPGSLSLNAGKHTIKLIKKNFGGAQKTVTFENDKYYNITVTLAVYSYDFILKWGENGTGNGQFQYAPDIALDNNGYLYVSDWDNHRMQKFDANGNFITKWGSPGQGAGKFDNPHGVIVDSNNNVYVTDYLNNRVQKFDSNGNFKTQWGSTGSGNGYFDKPWGIAVDNSGYIYVSDWSNFRIQEFDSNGNYITQWGSNGTGDGQFKAPFMLAVDNNSNVYVSDYFNQRIQKFDSNGNFITKWGSSGSGEGQFKDPRGIGIDNSGYLYITDGNHRIQKFTPDGTFITEWGSYGSENGQFHYPTGVVVDSAGNVYIADNYNHRVQKFEIGAPNGNGDWNITITSGVPEISLNRSQLNFGAVIGGISTTPQTFLISNNSGGTLNWVITDNVNWLNYSSDSGQDSEVITVAVDPTGLAVDTHTAIIAVSDVNASNSPQLIDVSLKVYNSHGTTIPFGSFATPSDGITGVTGSIAVTGWVLDDIEVQSVKIYRKVGGGISYIGDAVFVEGARPDVEQAYPDYPYNYRAGWGYMLLTNFLPDGNLVLTAIARDTTGREVELGNKTITVDNANAVKPFGAIDTPTQGGEATGTRYRNNGWALTPQPNKIPESGSTIKVWIDGVFYGNPGYNYYRSDIATLFPGYANSNGAWGFIDVDTTVYSNGVHTISWTVTDNAGNTDGIGSRYFTIQNTGGSTGRKGAAFQVQPSTFNFDLFQVPVNYSEPIIIRKGYSESNIPQRVYPDDKGMINIEITELQRIELHFDTETGHFVDKSTAVRYEGYLMVNHLLRPLPPGSTLDTARGIFYWQAGPGFLGEYRFIFIKKAQNSEERKDIKVKILPGFRFNEKLAAPNG